MVRYNHTQKCREYAQVQSKNVNVSNTQQNDNKQYISKLAHFPFPDRRLTPETVAIIITLYIGQAEIISITFFVCVCSVNTGDCLSERINSSRDQHSS